MIKLNLWLELNYFIASPVCDFIFNIEAAHTPSQIVSHEKLELSQPLTPLAQTDPVTGNRYTRVKARQGTLRVQYKATVNINHYFAVPAQVAEIPVAELPGQVLCYLYPSRYCQSDRLIGIAYNEFGHLPPGYNRVLAIKEWVLQRTRFTPNSSNSNTSALDTLNDRMGVCRDYAHLMIALCRAINIPARFTTGIDYGADPALGPTDFHAYVEVYLSGRWYIFDPSGTAIPMGFVRFGTGRDAADVAFATIFGAVHSQAPIIGIEAEVDAGQDIVMPYRSEQGLSTDSAPVRW